MSCCGGSPVSRSLREAKSLSVLLTRNWGVGVVGGASIAGMGVGVIGGVKSSGETWWRWECNYFEGKKAILLPTPAQKDCMAQELRGRCTLKGKKKATWREGGRESLCSSRAFLSVPCISTHPPRLLAITS